MKKKVLVTSLLTIALCISVICGATLAIFTSNNTTKIDINSANVETESTVKFVGYKTLGQEWVTEVDEKNIKFDSKDPITASIDESGNISMNNLRAGDKARIELKVTNKSNISINYHMTLTADNAAVWTDLSVAVKEGGTEVTLGTDPANNLIKGTDWNNAGAVSGAESAELAAYEIEIGFDDAFAGGAVDNYSLTINTVAQQGNAPTTNFIGSADRVEDLVEQGYTTADSKDDMAAAMANGEKVVLTDDISFDMTGSASHIQELNGVMDANGHTFKMNMAPGGENTPAYFNGTGEIRNAKFEIDGSWGIYTGDISYYNCVFVGAKNIYLEPHTVGAEIVVDGCSFLGGSHLSYVFEMTKVLPSEVKMTVTNNYFESAVPTEDNGNAAGINFILMNAAVDVFNQENYADYIIIEGNTFNCIEENKNFYAMSINVFSDDVIYDENINIEALLAGNTYAELAQVAVMKRSNIDFTIDIK